MTRSGVTLAQAQAIPYSTHDPLLEYLWPPALILFGLLLYWWWLGLIIPRIRSRRGVIGAVAAHLAAAAALNVAVAWIAALCVGDVLRNGVAMPWVGAGPNPHSPRHVALFAAEEGPAHRALLGLYDDGAFCHEHVILQTGFPFACMTGTWHDPASAGVPRATYFMIHKISQTAPMAPGARVPTEILPIRFTLNTFLYAVILALPLQRFALRKRWRSHHGLCVQCGYDLTGIDRLCPECGVARDRFDVTTGRLPLRSMLRRFANSTARYTRAARSLLAETLGNFPTLRHPRASARRNKCPNCGYNLAGLAGADRGVCPECGATP